MKKPIFCVSLFVVSMAFAASTEFEASNVIGVMPVKAQGRPQVILSIPWVEPGGTNDLIAVTNLVKTAGLTAGIGEDDGDTLSWYNTASGEFEVWRLVDNDRDLTTTNYYWQSTFNETTLQPFDSPDKPKFSRGQAVILARASSNEVMYVIGQVGTNSTVTSTIAGSDDGVTAKYTLLAPPYASGSATNINFVAISGDIDPRDVITSDIVSGLQVALKRDGENNKWVNSYNGKEEEAMIQAGRGFFYRRFGEGDLTITWGVPSVNN